MKMFKLELSNWVNFRYIQWTRIQIANYFQYIFHITLKTVTFAISAILFQTIVFIFKYFFEQLHEMPFKGSPSSSGVLHIKSKIHKILVFPALFHTTL